MRVYAKNFIYDGISSDVFGLCLASFSGGGLETTSAGSAQEAITDKASGSDRWYYYGKQYKEPLSFTIQLTRSDGGSFTLQERTAIARWLMCTDGYKPFSFPSEDYTDIIFYAQAEKISELSVGNVVTGFEVQFKTNAPYGYSPVIHKDFTLTGGNSTFTIQNLSDEVGMIYPYVVIELLENCDLSIKNSREDYPFELTKCTSGECIRLDTEHRILTTSKASHKICDCFNWKWIHLVRSKKETKNVFTVKGRCHLSFQYQLIRKVGVE